MTTVSSNGRYTDREHHLSFQAGSNAVMVFGFSQISRGLPLLVSGTKVSLIADQQLHTLHEACPRSEMQGSVAILITNYSTVVCLISLPKLKISKQMISDIHSVAPKHMEGLHETWLMLFCDLACICSIYLSFHSKLVPEDKRQ